MPPMTGPDLLAEEGALPRTLEKNSDTFDTFYRLYLTRIYGYIYARTGNSQDAEDLTSQTFLAAFENLSRLHDATHSGAWLFGIARNKIADHYRRSQVNDPLDEEFSASQAVDPLEALLTTEKMVALRSALRSLSEEERELLRLRCIAALPFAEIGVLLRRNEQAVKKAYYRLKDRLQVHLEDQDVH